MSVPAATAQKLVRMALQKNGILNRHDNFVPAEMLSDGLDSLWQLLDMLNGESLMIPYITHASFAVTEGKRTYTYGTNGDFNGPRPLEIIAASWLDAANIEWPIEVIDVHTYTTGTPFKRTSSRRPTQLYYEPSYPTGQIFFNAVPYTDDTLLLKVKLPFDAEYCACCDGDECDTGCVDPACSGGTIDPDNYTITVAGCPDGDDACILSGETQMEAYLATQCTTDCNKTFEQDFSYDPGGGAITITATAVKTPRTAMLPTQLALTRNTEFPPAYYNMLIWNLAEFIAPEYNMEPSSTVVMNARRAKSSIKNRNARPPISAVDSALKMPRAYDIYAGPTGRYR